MKNILAFSLLIPWLVWAQSGSRADDPCRAAALQTIPRAQGTHVNPSGRTIVVTDKCLLVDGRPVVPVMGEVHYSRIPANEWADVLRTMKEGGVSIVATYVFWNHHEWTRGAYDFSGDRDLSRFLAEVKKAGLWAVVRLGPWAHGEAREGGFPDWLIDEAVAQAGGDAKKMRGLLRAKNPWFLGETEKFWTRLLPEVEPHFWKHGGPVVAVQLENESRGPWPYYQALKELAVKVGYDVPFYTRTGWPRLNGPETTFGEIIPLYGDYAEGFWDRELKSMPGAYKDAFVMRPARTSSVIATEQLGRQKAEDAQGAARYPYFTCELGGGMTSSYHRRLNMEPLDAFAIGVVKLGSGSNLPGYYMYAGGQNPTDRGVSLGESQRDRFTNYNDLPAVSYEFQSPVSAFGDPQYAYPLIRELARFCDQYGAEFALEDPVFVNKHETRRGRFVFHNDYVRRLNPKGACWIGIEKDGKVERLLDGQALAAGFANVTVPEVTPELRLVKSAGEAPPVTKGVNGVAQPPDESAWAAAAEYEVVLPNQATRHANDRTLLSFPYEGDMARLYADGVLVQDDFWKGLPIRYALRRLPKGTKRLVLKVLPRGAGWEDKVYVDIIPSLLPRSAVVSSEGLANQDRNHFDREAQRILGGERSARRLPLAGRCDESRFAEGRILDHEQSDD